MTASTTVQSINSLISDDYLPIAPGDDLLTMAAYFQSQHGFSALPVVSETRLIGSIRSCDLLTACGRADKKSLTAKNLMSMECPTVQNNSSLVEICRQVRNGEISLEAGYLCLVDSEGTYKGLVTVQKLLVEITQLRLNFTRYNNPLSRLPGSVHVDETIDNLMENNRMFVVVHCDINDFRSFNDAYGYSRGDEVILFVAGMLQDFIDPDLDFVAHTGGDDFTLIFQSPDWFERCENMERKCSFKAAQFYSEKHRYNQGISTFDRMGRRVFSPFFTLALGAVQAEPGKFLSHHEIIAAAREVKQRAKSTFGGAIYIDERGYTCAQTSRPLVKN